MSLMEDVEKAKKAKEGGASASAPATAPAQAAGGKEAKSKIVDAFKASGAAERAKMSDDQKAMEGSKSGVLAFQNSIGDPTKSRSRLTNKGYIKSPLIVGYTFTASEAIQIPVCPLKEEAADHMDTVENATWKEVPAGEAFNLNIVETAMLLSQVAYGGQATGGTDSVYLYATSSRENQKITPSMRCVEGSIKEKVVYIADVKGEGESRQVTLNPGFEAFKPLLTKKSLRRGGSGKGNAKGETLKDTAAAFRKLYASMGGTQ